MHQLVFFLLGPISFCGKLNGPATSQRKWKVYVIFAMKMNNSPSEIFNNQIVKEKERRDTITANVIMHHFRQVILGKPLFQMCWFYIWALGCPRKTLFQKNKKWNPPRISLRVSLNRSKRIFDFDQV